MNPSTTPGALLTNDPLLETDESHDRNDLSMVNQKLETVLATQRPDSPGGAIQVAQDQVNRLPGVLSPLHQLPAEILSKVMFYESHSENSPSCLGAIETHGPWRLAQVSSGWRDTALSYYSVFFFPLPVGTLNSFLWPVMVPVPC